MKYDPTTHPIIVKCHSRDTLPIDALMTFQGGLKRLTKENRDKLIGSICEKGFIAPIFIWQNDGDNKLLDGHQRTATLNYMRQKGWEIPLLPVDYIEADSEKDAKEKLLLITSQYGEFTLEGFEEFSAGLDLNTDNVHLSDGTFDLPSPEAENDTTGDDDVPDADNTADSVLGEIYQLGKHRLMCGDSTIAEQVATLMAGEQADLWVTDPPYNVEYTGKTKDALTIQNDKQGDASFLAFLVDAFRAATSVLREGGAFYIWHADIEGFNFRTAAKEASLQIRQCLIWNKNCMVMGRQDYQGKHEPCLYGWKDGAGHYWDGGRSQTTVFDETVEYSPKKMTKEELIKLCTELLEDRKIIKTTIINMDKPSRSAEHPTMKPVKLFQIQIENSSAKNEIVLDTFAGSGTTIIAAEKVGRKARVMELDPIYCDVIRKRWSRWADENGIEPGPGALAYEPEDDDE